ncbi:MAG: hypothetical protein DCC65_09995 [Planctomycetota bacterium]|nr:MAG: hypothetical protein DCC65_09995 [Planctomycetota bacterium]
MGLRKRYVELCDNSGLRADLSSFGTLGNFLLEPSLDGSEADERERDRWRLAVFDIVAGFRADIQLDGRTLPNELRQAITDAADQMRNTIADGKKKTGLRRLFQRLGDLEEAHRLVLLKSAAEWIVARYLRSVENWVRQHTEWEKEKQQWESHKDNKTDHTLLTPDIREKYTAVFKLLVWDKDKPPGVRNKRPRICPYDRLKQNIDNCCYAGQKGHGPLCWKYNEFVKARKARNPSFNDKKFAEDVAKYLPPRAKGEQRHLILKAIFPNKQQDQQRFSDNWTAYLSAMKLNEQTLVQHQQLPHCLKIGETFEKSACVWNPHTDLCGQYHRALVNPNNGFDDAMLSLEPLYRAWRRNYLAGPRKPSFRYPASRDLPMPKIFGDGFHEVDFENSIVRLRLDDMPRGQWLDLGFTPWPRGYKPSRAEISEPGRVTSVHVHFVGVRARIGFRFEVAHAPSRFGCTQDEIDELRSRHYPRQAQDQEFLEAARKCLLDSMTEGSENDLRIMAVDLGEKGACAAVYRGRTREMDIPLAIVKINKLYEKPPKTLEPDRHSRPEESKRKFEEADPRGVRKEHVGRHLERVAAMSQEIAKHRQPAVATTVTVSVNDLRGLKRHVAWMIRDWARHNASQIVKAAEEHQCDVIVFESLRGFRPPGYDKLDEMSAKKKRWLAMFAYGRVRRKVIEKAVERGMRVVTVPYFKSSQVCSDCGREQVNVGLLRKNKLSKGQFVCENCKVTLTSDANAARVLARVFRGEIMLPKARPGA